MCSVNEYIESLKEIYSDKVVGKASSYDETSLALIPVALRELYREYAAIELPFGYTYTIEQLIEHSQAEPFKSEGWFCFGFDGYFSFWLCKQIPDEENLSFTSWDHDFGEIGEAMYETLTEFFQCEQIEYEENRNIGSVILEQLPSDKIRFLSKVRRTFSLTTSSRELLDDLAVLPYTVIEDVSFSDAEEMIDETGHPECFTFRSNGYLMKSILREDASF